MKNLKDNAYYILLLNRKQISLFKVHDTNISEVHDGVFPMPFVDDYEYAKSSRGTSFGYALKSFEKDKSLKKKERFKHFLNAVNEKLKNYLNKNSALLLMGTDEDRVDFKHVSDYNHLIIEEFSGSFKSGNLGRFKKSILNTIKKTI